MTSVLIECAHDTENNEGEQCKQRSQAVCGGGGRGRGRRGEDWWGLSAHRSVKGEGKPLGDRVRVCLVKGEMADAYRPKIDMATLRFNKFYMRHIA